MAGKTYIAKQETSEAIQADTTAIRNTLGIFPGGGIEDTVASKLDGLVHGNKGLQILGAKMKEPYTVPGINKTSFTLKSAVVWQDDLYVLGTTGTTTFLAYKLNKITRAWEEYSTAAGLTTSNRGLEGIYSCVVYHNEIHALIHRGGQHFKYNGTEWVSVSTLPYTASYYDSCSVVYDNKIHMLGGTAASGDYTNATKHYSWNGTTWKEESTLPYQFYNGAVCVYKNKLHIFGGGYNSDGALNNSYNHYSWNGSSWIKELDLPYSFINQNAIVYNNELRILTSAGSRANMNDKMHYKYDENKEVWVRLTDVPASTGEMPVIVFEGKLWHFVTNTQIYILDYGMTLLLPKGTKIYTDLVLNLAKNEDNAYIVPETQEVDFPWDMATDGISALANLITLSA